MRRVYTESPEVPATESLCPTTGGSPSVLGRHQTYPGRAARPPPPYRGGPGRVRPAAGGDKDTQPARRSPPPHSPAGHRASAAPLTAPPPAYSASAAAAAWADASASGWNRRRVREGALPCPGVGRGSQPSLRAGPALAAAAAALLREACVTQLEQRGVVSSEKNNKHQKSSSGRFCRSRALCGPSPWPGLCRFSLPARCLNFGGVGCPVGPAAVVPWGGCRAAAPSAPTCCRVCAGLASFSRFCSHQEMQTAQTRPLQPSA